MRGVEQLEKSGKDENGPDLAGMEEEAQEQKGRVVAGRSPSVGARGHARCLVRLPARWAARDGRTQSRGVKLDAREPDVEELVLACMAFPGRAYGGRHRSILFHP
jgi:hypothetical protein